MTSERSNISQALLAFIVDQYLSRNQFFQTRVIFRNEASSLLANLPTNKNLLSLEEMLNQYIFLKKQNVLFDKEKAMVMHEKNRIQMLLQDIQNIVDNFNARPPLLNAATMITNSPIVSPVENCNTTSPVMSTGTIFCMQNTMSLSPKPMDNNFSSPVIKVFDKKRKSISTVDGSTAAKRPRGRPPGKRNQVQGTNMCLPSPNNKVDFGSSSATNQPLVENCGGSQISTNPVSRTHPIINSSHSGDTHVSLPSDALLPTDISHVVSTKKVMVEHEAQIVYKEGNCDITPIQAYLDQANTSKSDADKTSSKTLEANSSHILENFDSSFSNEIPIFEFGKEKEDWTNFDFPNIELDD